MQMDEPARLRKDWGDKPCDHKSLDKEYHLGSATGDYVCKQCGRSGPGRDWPEKEGNEGWKPKLRAIEVERYGSDGYKPRKTCAPITGKSHAKAVLAILYAGDIME
jgi:hypothetical protein